GIGTWYYKLIAGDFEGHLSPPSDFLTVIVPDFTPPSTPTAVTTSVSGPSVTVNWTASTDDIGVQSYQVYRGTTPDFTPSGTPVGTVLGTSFTETVPAATYYYKVVALDAVGNTSTPSTAAEADVIDNTPPTQPTNLGGEQSGQVATLHWTGSTDTFGVAG